MPQNPYDSEQITVSNTAIGFTAAKITPADNGGKVPVEAFVSVQDDAIRFTVDGTTPTASLGHVLEAGSVMRVMGQTDIRQLRMIRVTTDAEVDVTFYKD